MTQSESLLEYALSEIRTRIQNGTYPPGHKLVTQDISNSLGISRTPVVAAINRLVAEGLAEAIPRRGTFVAQLSVKKIKDLLEVRYMIEMFAVKPAIKYLDYFPEKIEEMQSLIEGLENLNDGDYARASEIDSRFHILYVSLSNNEQLLKIYESNWSVGATYYMYGLAKMPLTRQKRIYQEHRDIVDLLMKKDAEGLQHLLEKHIASPMEALDWLIENDTHNIFKK